MHNSGEKFLFAFSSLTFLLYTEVDSWCKGAFGFNAVLSFSGIALSHLHHLQALRDKKVNPGPSSASNLPSSRSDYAQQLQEIMNTTWNSNGMPAMQEHGNVTRAKTYTNSGRYSRVRLIIMQFASWKIQNLDFTNIITPTCNQYICDMAYIA